MLFAGDGKLQVTELVENWPYLIQYGVNGPDLYEAFKALDLNNDGYVRIVELKVSLFLSIMPNNGECFRSPVTEIFYRK